MILKFYRKLIKSYPFNYMISSLKLVYPILNTNDNF